MERFINLSVLSNPRNWISIGAMAIVVLVAIFVIYTRVQANKNMRLNDETSNLASEKAE